jgi:hypothetical protein
VVAEPAKVTLRRRDRRPRYCAIINGIMVAKNSSVHANENAGRGMMWRARYLLIGGIALVGAAGEDRVGS